MRTASQVLDELDERMALHHDLLAHNLIEELRSCLLNEKRSASDTPEGIPDHASGDMR